MLELKRYTMIDISKIIKILLSIFLTALFLREPILNNIQDMIVDGDTVMIIYIDEEIKQNNGYTEEEKSALLIEYQRSKLEENLGKAFGELVEEVNIQLIEEKSENIIKVVLTMYSDKELSKSNYESILMIVSNVFHVDENNIIIETVKSRDIIELPQP